MEFVDFDLAKKLKEKGFNEPCYAFYTEHGSLQWNNIDTYYRPNQEISLEDLTNTYNDGNSICLTDAPTISQVLKWLMDEKKIAINIEFIPYAWQYKIIDMSFDRRFEPYGITLFSDYKEAAIAGIEYVLDNIL